ncbi:MAG: hypothetical protein K9K64_05255 [Desulfohalobiaceae bacterium]|nr:hypothetical protein [Desulfohalobiaceae bacterium]
MDFLDKAKIRLEHWIEHNEQHQEEYSKFASELAEAGRLEAAKQVEAMVELTAKSSECLKKALQAI